MKKRIVIIPLMTIGFVLLFTVSCKKTTTPDPIPEPVPTTVSDFDGNVYHWVTIGTQTWMVENLKTTHYRNGDPIPNEMNASAWSTLLTGAYCDFSNTPANVTTYGRLYNWYAVTDTRSIAPTGWHVASDAEWTTLISYIGHDTMAGGVLKEAGLAHWQSPNAGATNAKGFTALPGGRRLLDGTFDNLTVFGFWWTTTPLADYDAYYSSMDCLYASIFRSTGFKTQGLSVRCVRD